MIQTISLVIAAVPLAALVLALLFNRGPEARPVRVDDQHSAARHFVRPPQR